MTHKAIKGADGYADLSSLQEDERIQAMAYHVMSGHGSATCVTDDTVGKLDRYIAKMIEWFPMIEVYERGDGPVGKTVYCKFRKKAN